MCGRTGRLSVNFCWPVGEGIGPVVCTEESETVLGVGKEGFGRGTSEVEMVGGRDWCRLLLRERVKGVREREDPASLLGCGTLSELVRG